MSMPALLTRMSIVARPRSIRPSSAAGSVRGRRRAPSRRAGRPPHAARRCRARPAPAGRPRRCERLGGGEADAARGAGDEDESVADLHGARVYEVAVTSPSTTAASSALAVAAEHERAAAEPPQLRRRRWSGRAPPSPTPAGRCRCRSRGRRGRRTGTPVERIATAPGSSATNSGTGLPRLPAGAALDHGRHDDHGHQQHDPRQLHDRRHGERAADTPPAAPTTCATSCTLPPAHRPKSSSERSSTRRAEHAAPPASRSCRAR